VKLGDILWLVAGGSSVILLWLMILAVASDLRDRQRRSRDGKDSK
jgi:hypothetical protein